MANLHKISDMTRGTTYTITGYYEDADGNTDITGATIFFTIKDSEYDSSSDDTTAVVKKTVSSFPDATGGQYLITVDPSDTATVTPANYYYDIKIKLSDGTIFKLDEGRVKVDGSPTNRQS